MNCSKGFTLIELLISLVIFSVVSVAALNSVNHMMRAREHQENHHDLNQALDMAYAHFFQDMIWFIGDVTAAEQELHFTRSQNTHAEGVATVIYRVRDGQLYRAVGASETLILDKVEDIRVSWLSSSSQWIGAFDLPVLEANPLLFRLQFVTPHLGEVTWVFTTAHL
jgi:prepilin-type N-terminal cleavage/methylation domain-containing protein